MPNKHIYRIPLVLSLLGSICVGGFAQEPANFIELTKVDLFTHGKWTSLDISVGGFRLGMTKQEAVRSAQKREYKILDALGQKQVCAERKCEVYSRNSRPLGLFLSYGDEGKLAEITIASICVYSDSVTCEISPSNAEWTSDLIARSFQGKTYQIFNQFTESFCQQLFGQADKKQEDAHLKVTWVSAEYADWGLNIRYEVFRRSAVEHDTSFEMTLVQPHTKASSTASGVKNSN